MKPHDLNHKIIFVIGVSGSGKSLIGRKLAHIIELPFIDADDHHPQSNVDKMANGIPLNNKDRFPWLDELNRIAREEHNDGCVIACSALKQEYRSRLENSIESKAIWIYLKGSYDQIFERMTKREDHFMGANMLQSQFDTLEEPKDAIVMNITDSPETIIKEITYIDES